MIQQGPKVAKTGDSVYGVEIGPNTVTPLIQLVVHRDLTTELVVPNTGTLRLTRAEIAALERVLLRLLYPDARLSNDKQGDHSHNSNNQPRSRQPQGHA
jgi:hypothetical protein